jgi:transposase
MINDSDTQPVETINARPRIEVYDSVERRRRWTSDEKQKLLKEADEPGNSISSVARKYGVSSSQMFNWRKQFQKGGQVAIKANDEVVPANDHKIALMRIRELERQLGKKTMEAEILKEAIQIAKEKKLLSRAQLQQADVILGQQ